MKIRIWLPPILLLIALLTVIPSYAEQAPDSLWWRVYGDYGKSIGFDVEPLPDGSVMVSGTHGSETEVPPNADPWLLKFDPDGNLVWESRLGGPQWDMGNGMALTPDGGYILCGSTASYGEGYTDIYVVKTDSLGQEEWHTTIGSGERDYGRDVEVTPEGDYVICGWTERLGFSNQEIVIAKLSGVDGSVMWAREYGGDDKEEAWTLEVLQDGNYAVAGRSWSFNATNNRDLIILKVTPDGDLIWYTTFGGPEKDHIYEFQETPDGGFICTGKTESFDIDQGDAWLLKYDSEGEQEWVSLWGTSFLEFGRSVDMTSDGGYIMSGVTQDPGFGNQILVAKADHNGDWMWEAVYGGTEMDDSWGIREMPDSGYAVTGLTWSEGLGERNLFVTRFDAPTNPVTMSVALDDDVIYVPADINWEASIQNNELIPLTGLDMWTRLVSPGVGYGQAVLVATDEIDIDPGSVETFQGSTEFSDILPDGEYQLWVQIGNYPESMDRNIQHLTVFNTDVDEGDGSAVLPRSYSVSEVHPNPFNATTSLDITLPTTNTVELVLYDINGRLIETVYNGSMPAGTHRIGLRADHLASGMYFVRATVPDKMNEVRKMILVR